MAKFHNLLVTALVTIRRTHKTHITDRGAETHGAEIPDLTLELTENSQTLIQNYYQLIPFLQL